MKTLTVDQICHATGGTLLNGDGERLAYAVNIDTRSLVEGELFVALIGENFDAHHFLDQAVEKNPAAIVVEHLPENFEAGEVAVIRVSDSLIGLQRLAHWYRRQYPMKVVGITGSNGKTSTKDFTKAVLSQSFHVNATKGNLNNHIGLPLSVLAAAADDEVSVLEMGMNHPGEIEPLCEICRPNIGIITNIGTAHIEYMGSREAIAEEKGALARSLQSDGTLLVTAGCDFREYLSERTKAKTIFVGNGRGAIRAENLEMHPAYSTFKLVIDGLGTAEVKLMVSGRHMINNALLAAGAGVALGMSVEDIAKGLNSSELTSGRLRSYEYDGILVLDDTYNANPESVAAGIETLAETTWSENGQRCVVLGKMAELGIHADEAHKKVGRLAAERGLRLISVGEGAEGITQGAQELNGAAEHFSKNEGAVEWLRTNVSSGDTVLFKGSRTAGMERVMAKVFPES